MSPEEMIVVIVAQSQGKTIEGRTKSGGEWVTVGHVDCAGFNFIKWEYRIKREQSEPRVIWVNEYPSGCRWGMPASSEKCAHQHKGTNAIATRKFIEVIE